MYHHHHHYHYYHLFALCELSMQLAECQPDLTKMTMEGRLSVNRGFKGVSIEGINTRQRMPSVHDPKIQIISANKIFTKILHVTRSELSVQLVPVLLCHNNLSLSVSLTDCFVHANTLFAISTTH